jgi:phage-related protein
MYQSMWRIEFLNSVAFAEVDALPRDMRSNFERIVELIKMHGLDKVREPYIKHIDGKIWEMRLKGKGGIARSLYITAIGRRVIVLRTFIKKTEKTPRREIDLALERAKELT